MRQKQLIAGCEHPRPTMDSVTQAAARLMLPEILQWLAGEENGDELETLTDLLSNSFGDDGYEMARDLEREGWTPNSELVEILDGAWGYQREALLQAEAAWVREFDIKPAFAVGDLVKVDKGDGIVVKVDEKHAHYTVSVPAEGHIGHLPKEPSHRGTIGFVLKFEEVN